MTVQEHTGTALWWRSGAEDWWHYQQMMVTDAEAAIAEARREGYVPKDAEVVETEPTYTNRQRLAHGCKLGLETISLPGIM